MSSRRLLWLGLVLAMPVPILVLGPGYVPAGRLLMLSAIAVSVMVLEQAGGALPLLATLLLAQALVYTLIWWVVSRLFARLASATLTILVLVALLAVALFVPLYDDPYQSISPQTNLLNVYR